MADFSCTPRQVGDTVVLALAGDIDLAVHDRLISQASTFLAPAGHLVLDCSGVTFLDSSGLRALLAVQQAAADNQGMLALASLSFPVAQVLDLTGTRQIFTIVDDPSPELTGAAG